VPGLFSHLEGKRLCYPPPEEDGEPAPELGADESPVDPGRDREAPGFAGAWSRIAPGGRPVLSPGVAGGKPGFVWDLGIVLLVPLVPVD
jgi:hypothetical protein